MIFGITEALKSLYPDAQWTIRNENYEELDWFSEDIEKPDYETIIDEIDRLQNDWDAKEYQRLRSNEYPSFFDYLDGVVKGDQKQVDQYIAECLAVKNKYQKPRDEL